jgi:hypothetical protein
MSKQNVLYDKFISSNYKKIDENQIQHSIDLGLALAEYQRVLGEAEDALERCVMNMPHQKDQYCHEWEVLACNNAKKALAAIAKLKQEMGV